VGSNRLLLVNVDSSEAGPPRPERRNQYTRFDQRRAARIDEQGCWFHAREVFGCNDVPGRLDEPRMQRDYIALLEESRLTWGNDQAVKARLIAGGLPVSTPG
jgi:hypothetical protein